MNLANNKAFRLALVGLAALLLAACDAVPTEVTTGLIDNRNTDYSGPACGIGAEDPADACSYKVNFWNRMSSYSCDNCHGGGNKSPHFLHQGDVNIAYSQTQTIVDRANIGQSRLIAKIANGHNCGTAGECTAMASVVTGYLNDWINGSANTGGGGGVVAVVLEPPAEKDPGDSKTLPDPATDNQVLGNFQPLHTLLTQYCDQCHVESAAIPQSPFFAESDAAAAYAALRSSQKLDLDTPSNSRLFVRLVEGHNCWDLTTASIASDKYVCATAMRTAIEAFADTIAPTEVDSNWIISKALKLSNGPVASDGVRDDSNTIALYEFKGGAGNVISDTSGVAPPLDLTLTGSEGIDFKWVGGWGMEFISSTAQATYAASNKLRERIITSGEYSIEAWLVPGNVSQGTAGEPARIISYSASHTERNFTLGQAEYRYEFMQRSSTTDGNGMPSLITDDGDRDLQAAQQHVVVTYGPDPDTGIKVRKVYVNGQDTGDSDPVSAGSLVDWDNTYALLFGSEIGGEHAWQGKLRLVAIHDRALTAAQIKQNFEAGVGEKFFLLFSISDHLDNANCFLGGVPQCFVMFQASQYDSYSYLFYKPTFISLNPDFQPATGIPLKGLRIGINGKEPGVGQAFINIDTTIAASRFSPGSNGGEEQQLSALGTIIALEKGADNDEFFLTFEQLGSKTDVRVEMVCGLNASCMTPAVDGQETSDIGLRTFDEINASMAAVTGIDMNAPGNASVKTTYGLVKQQLPTVETLQGFLPAHQMGVIQVAIQYCNALVNDSSARSSFYGGFDFTADVASAYGSGDSAQKNQMLDALYDRMLGLPDGSGTVLANVPSRAALKAELFGPAATNPDNLFDRLADNTANGTDAARTRAIAKALCTATLSSAALLIQ